MKPETMIPETMDLLFTQFALLGGTELPDWIGLPAGISIRGANVSAQFVLFAVTPYARQGYQAVAIKKYQIEDEVFHDIHRLCDYFNRSKRAQFARIAAAQQAVDDPLLLTESRNGHQRWSPALDNTSRFHDTGWRQNGAGWYRRQIYPSLDRRIDLRQDGDDWVLTLHLLGKDALSYYLGRFGSLEAARRDADLRFLPLPWTK